MYKTKEVRQQKSTKSFKHKKSSKSNEVKPTKKLKNAKELINLKEFKNTKEVKTHILVFLLVCFYTRRENKKADNKDDALIFHLWDLGTTLKTMQDHDLIIVGKTRRCCFIRFFQLCHEYGPLDDHDPHYVTVRSTITVVLRRHFFAYIFYTRELSDLFSAGIV